MPTKQSDGRYRAKVTIPGVEKPVYISARTKKELEEKKQQVKDQYINGEKAQPKPFVEVVKEWFENVKLPSGKAPSTIEGYRTAINQHVIPHFPRQKLISSVTRNDLQECLNKTAGWSETLCRKTKAVLVETCRYAVASGYIRSDPSSFLVLKFAPQKTRKTYFSEDEELYIQSLTDGQFGLYVQILYYTGMRLGEAVALQWEDVDFENSLIRVRRDFDFTIEAVGNLKTQCSRRNVYIPDRLLHMLEERKSTGDIFCYPLTKHKQFYRTWEEYFKSNITPHYFRHHYVTSCILAGLPIVMTMRQVGHSSYNTTLGVYTHIMEDGKKQKTLLQQVIVEEVARKLPIQNIF